MSEIREEISNHYDQWDLLLLRTHEGLQVDCESSSRLSVKTNGKPKQNKITV